MTKGTLTWPAFGTPHSKIFCRSVGSKPLDLEPAAHEAGGGARLGRASGSWRSVSPARSSANLNSTGPTISLMATAAMASERKPGPKVGNALEITTDRPSARPACEIREDQAQRLRMAGSSATRLLRRPAMTVKNARLAHSATATGPI